MSRGLLQGSLKVSRIHQILFYVLTMVQPTIAVIGAGHWGKNLIRNLYELGALHTICTRDKATLNALLEHYQGSREQYRSTTSCGTKISTRYALQPQPIPIVSLPKRLLRPAKMFLLKNLSVYLSKMAKNWLNWLNAMTGFSWSAISSGIIRR
jgi:hypothetical protein